MVGLLWLVIYTIALGAIVRVTVAHADGRALPFGDAAAGGLRVAVPLVVVSILYGLAVGIGSIFLIVPGIILAVMWSVAIPARAIEPIGIFAAFGRSRALTKGARWTIFGFGVVVFLIYVIVSAVFGLVFFASVGTAGFMAMAQQQQEAPVWSTIAGAVLTTLVTAILTALHGALYVDLRNWKDGPATSRLADIFA